MTGRIVVDTTNNRVGPRPEDIVDLGQQSSSEARTLLADTNRAATPGKSP
ncbi:MAG: hypothetical protein ACR2MQ_02960 [Gemmatimonadaceae bacterium]